MDRVFILPKIRARIMDTEKGEVFVFKNKFYRSKSARYDLANPSTMKLVPNKEYIKVIKEDYKAMSGMTTVLYQTSKK